jgi:hypothetical protein
MNQDFILGKLAGIMGWDDAQARVEFAWLRLISRMKFDGYQDFLAGARFVESLADWLQQFRVEDRQTAYAMVRHDLVYISTAEMNHLVELFYPETVQWRLQQEVASREKIPAFRVWATPRSAAVYRRLLRQTLFIELSDGARIDVFRRANAGTISNEQIVTAPRINEEKWGELLKDLRKDLEDSEARFAFVFLIDDFIASGTTLLRLEDGKWKGKLPKFWTDVQLFLATHFESGWKLCVHHYLATHRASQAVMARQAQALAALGKDRWFEEVRFSFGTVLPEDFPLDQSRHGAFLDLTQQYYDDSIETRHTRVGGSGARLGFGECCLPLVLEHNTPNNSVAILWAESVGGPGRHAMRPLFRRRQRHT